MSHCDTAILKNLMLFLKTKSLTSENLFKRETREVDNMLMDLLGVFQRYYDQAQESDRQTVKSMLDLLILVSEQVHSSHRQGESTIDDFKIYITALEGNYKNADSDFGKTVTQPAQRETQEKAREEEEQARVIDEYRRRGRPKFYE